MPKDGAKRKLSGQIQPKRNHFVSKERKKETSTIPHSHLLTYLSLICLLASIAAYAQSNDDNKMNNLDDHGHGKGHVRSQRKLLNIEHELRQGQRQDEPVPLDSHSCPGSPPAESHEAMMRSKTVLMMQEAGNEATDKTNLTDFVTLVSYSTEPVELQYIVRFKRYLSHRQQERLIAKAIGDDKYWLKLDGKGKGKGIDKGSSSSNGSRFCWQLVKRDNRASGLPSDFALLEFKNYSIHSDLVSDALVTLRSQKIVRSVTPQYQVIRKLQMISHREADKIEGRWLGRFTMEVNAESNPFVMDSFNKRLPSGSGIDRELLSASPQQVTSALHAEQLWSRGFSGKGVKVAIFDTGLNEEHPHFRNIMERSDWTNEKILDDELGHGSFVAGVIASSKECLGFAPDAELYIFRVFTKEQVSYTSWFLDAFNFAIHKKINVLNLSIGGPDFMDMPFVEKVYEMSANGIIMISAIGNDGPLYGTLNNPADQSDVIGVGGLGQDGSVAHFSSRGMTTWELPRGYGRVKPDIVTMGYAVTGSHRHTGCRQLSGTSVASPVVAGVVTLLASVIDPEVRWSFINPASMKQALIESASPIADANIFEQGFGKLNLIGAFNILMKYSPRASLVPSKLDLTECPYMWPFCSQPLYHGAIPIIFNVTILNGMGVIGYIEKQPVWVPASNGELLDITFSFSTTLWPWTGHLAVYFTVKDIGRDFDGIAEGHIELSISSPSVFPETLPRVDILRLPIRAAIIPTPRRELRVLWDQYHNLRYPSGYFPRDNLKHKEDPLDWNGDHLHTNFKELYEHLRLKGYFVEVLGQPLTCFDARQYGTLLIVDPEEEFFDEERHKLVEDVVDLGLSVIIAADWYNVDVMQNKIKFYDENTKQWWTPETGGSNIPALNELLEPFGIAFGSKVFNGLYSLDPTAEVDFELVKNGAGSTLVSSHTGDINGIFPYLSGTSIVEFPKKGFLSLRSFIDQTDEMIKGLSHVDQRIPVMGFLQTPDLGGRIVVYGDSNCLDSAHNEGTCFTLLDHWLSYTADKIITPALEMAVDVQEEAYHGIFEKPLRSPSSKLHLYSKVMSPISNFYEKRPLSSCVSPSLHAILPLNGTVEDFDPHVLLSSRTFGRILPEASGPESENLHSPDKSVQDSPASSWKQTYDFLSSPAFLVLFALVLSAFIVSWIRSRGRQRKLWVV